MKLFQAGVVALTAATSALAATVTVDLTPCILASTTIVKDDAATPDAYLTSVFYQGYWGAVQLTPAATTGTLDLTNSATYGKCNVVYVGIVVTEAQKLQLQTYSSTFKVRIVYFNAAETSNDPEVNSRLGISQDFTEPLLSAPFIALTTSGASVSRVVSSSLTTNPRENNVFTRPVYQAAAAANGTATIVAQYVDAGGSMVPSSLSFPSVAAMAYVSPDGYEELHLFFSVAWFDLGSWAWGHFFVEWGTKGVFQGERRFYLGAMVDDLFLSTGVFVYDGLTNEGTEERLTGSDMAAFKSAENSINSQYGSSVVTEFPYNGLGILEKVDSAYVLEFADADIALLPKGEQVQGTGITPQLPVNWLATAVAGMTAEFNAGSWASDDLLVWVLANLSSFWWQSHTLSHLARDNLGESDCAAEDGGNAQIAVLTGMFASDNYDWRSMTTPGITGLFNQYCLTSAVSNLITCAPGDNTYDGVQTSVSLISDVSQFHSITTTTGTNGYAGFQIAPRYATFVYFNCVTGACLVAENEYIRRIVCGCSNLDPSGDRGTCSLCDDIQSFGSVEALFSTEAKTTTRQILMGRRDKYMFHQANVIPTALSGGSLLGHWFEQVMAEISTYIAFPVTSNKFDDHCEQFTLHEELDNSGAVLTATVDNVSGSITGVSLSASGTAGYIPFTVPSSSSIPTSGLTVGSSTTYGSDTTYYVATAAGAVPTPASAPAASELAPTGTASGSIVEATTDPVDLATDSPAIEATSLGDAAAPILATAAGDEDAAVGSETVTPVEAVTVTTAPTDAVVAATAAPTDAVADNVTTAPVDAATSAPVDAATAAPVTSATDAPAV